MRTTWTFHSAGSLLFGPGAAQQGIVASVSGVTPATVSATGSSGLLLSRTARSPDIARPRPKRWTASDTAALSSSTTRSPGQDGRSASQAAAG